MLYFWNNFSILQNRIQNIACALHTFVTVCAATTTATQSESRVKRAFFLLRGTQFSYYEIARWREMLYGLFYSLQMFYGQASVRIIERILPTDTEMQRTVKPTLVRMWIYYTVVVGLFLSDLTIAMQVNLAFCCPSWRIRSFPLSHSPFRSDMNDHEQNYFVFFVFYTSPLLFIHHAVDQIDNINHNDHLFVRQMKNKFAGQWKFLLLLLVLLVCSEFVQTLKRLQLVNESDICTRISVFPFSCVCSHVLFGHFLHSSWNGIIKAMT